MLPDRVSNPGPLTYESGALPTVLRGPAVSKVFEQLKFDCLEHGSPRLPKTVRHCGPHMVTFEYSF